MVASVEHLVSALALVQGASQGIVVSLVHLSAF